MPTGSGGMHKPVGHPWELPGPACRPVPGGGLSRAAHAHAAQSAAFYFALNVPLSHLAGSFKQGWPSSGGMTLLPAFTEVLPLAQRCRQASRSVRMTQRAPGGQLCWRSYLLLWVLRKRGGPTSPSPLPSPSRLPGRCCCELATCSGLLEGRGRPESSHCDNPAVGTAAAASGTTPLCARHSPRRCPQKPAKCGMERV